ncbi:organic cation transporter protein-like isoform X1 [Haliotis rubra]|uniref:organic cation transporter protein-like isoform X1 n=1 Tax=Haliotis rubra TaxID=36100 RepID=UPI001EE4F150|nr:organic cation transporter protein-like isoform X1 [Haliotis rubra]
MRFDDLLRTIGEFGPYQRRLYVLLCLPAIAIAIQSISLVVFLFAVPEHRCAIPGLKNDTYEVQDKGHEYLINLTIPRLASDNVSYLPCKVYTDVTLHRDDNHTRPLNRYTETCHSWVYDKSSFDTTIAQSMNMVCEKKSYVTHGKMLNMAGQAIGVVFSGFLSDTFGRKTVIVVSMVLTTVLNVVLTWVTSFYVLIPVVILMTACSSTQYLASFVFGLELVGHSKRMWAGVAINFFWSAGNMIVALAAFLLRDWKTRQLVLGVPSFIFLYLFFIPESPRWLLSTGQNERAKKTLLKIAESNGVTISDYDLESVTTKEESKIEYFWELIKSPTLSRRILILFYNWFAVGMCFYGLSMNVTNLSGNVYLNFFLFVSVEACAYVLCVLLLDRMGRKWMLCGSMIAGGVACLLSFFPFLISKNPEKWIINLLACLGNTCVSAGFAALYVFTGELLPTTSRNSGIGLCSMFCRGGSLVSPYINDLVMHVEGRYQKIIPTLIFGSITALAGFLALRLPETLNRKLPENIRDAENLMTYAHTEDVDAQSVRSIEQRTREMNTDAFL